MNNEEKILEMLEKMDSRQTKTEELLEKMDSRLDKLEAGQAKLEAGQAAITEEIVVIREDMTEMRGDITKIRHNVTFIENDHGNLLKALSDGRSANMEMIAQIAEDVTFLKNKTESQGIRLYAHDASIGELQKKKETA